MAKNKLLTIPIEEEKRERLNQYCGDRGKTVSQMITGFIDKLLDGSIDPSASIESSRPPIEIDMAVIVAEVWNRLHELPSPSVDSSDLILRMADIEAGIKRLRREMDKLLINNGTYPVQTIDSPSVKPAPYTLTDISTSQQLHQSIDPETIENTQITHVPKSIVTATTEKPIEQPIDQSLEPYTLEDTKTYLKDKCDYNRTRERRGDRISQTDISIHLTTYNYPHPSKKKWNRDEVRAVCKLWEFRT